MSTARSTQENGATLGFEQTLWQAANKMRGHMDSPEYKRVLLWMVAPSCRRFDGPQIPGSPCFIAPDTLDTPTKGAR